MVRVGGEAVVLAIPRGSVVGGAVGKGLSLEMLAVTRGYEIERWCLVGGTRSKKRREVGGLGSVGSVVAGHDK